MTHHNIDRMVVRYVFDESSIRTWHFPRSVYRQALVSLGELETRVAGRAG